MHKHHSRNEADHAPAAVLSAGFGKEARMTLTVLDPRQGPSALAVIPAKRLKSLDKKRLGLLWNHQPGGDRLLKHVAEFLQQKYDFAEIYFTEKTFVGNAAPAEIIDDLASRVDAVVVGVGDCGSCTSASVIDTINLERKGIPSAIVGQDKLVNTTGKAMARVQGYPSLNFAVFPYLHREYGVTGTEAELKARAAELAPQVESILTGGDE